jgi:hypothetical protein
MTATEERTLPGQRFEIVLADGTGFTARVTNREYVLWDKTARQHKWGSATESPFTFASFIAWAAARRDGLYEPSFETFQKEAEQVLAVDGDEDDAARPTR